MPTASQLTEVTSTDCTTVRTSKQTANEPSITTAIQPVFEATDKTTICSAVEAALPITHITADQTAIRTSNAAANLQAVNVNVSANAAGHIDSRPPSQR